MKHLQEPLNHDENAGGTSFFHTEVRATINQLKAILGEADYTCNDGSDKVNFEWNRKTKSGAIFTVYDWKHYRRLKYNEIISWHIGGHNGRETEEAAKEIKEALSKAIN